jgi:hypothetical protein
MVCVRRAWLTMGSLRLELEDEAAGYFCTELDLGYPDVREVTSNRPDRDGVDDRTRLMGSRAVSANIRGTDGGTMTPDEIATIFAPYMIPGVRPQLHYVLDRPGAPERFVTVRAAGYAWPISGERSREIQLSWVAPDPVLRDPTVRVATAFAGSSVTGGRTYSLTFDRTYPPAGSGGPTVAIISSAGDVPVRPRVDIYGPITDPVVTFDATDAGGAPLESFVLRFAPGFRVDAGTFVSIDTDAKTITDRTGASLMGRLDWSGTVWPILPVAPDQSRMTLAGSSSSPITQVQATWTDGYLA